MAEGLPLAFAALPDVAEAVAPREPAVARACRSSAPERAVTADSPLAIDLSSLWAGPLCGQLLRQTGARVIKVESAAALRARLQGAGARRLMPCERGVVRACGADWRLRVGDIEAPVAAPWALPARNERAAPAGAHTQRILGEIDRR